MVFGWEQMEENNNITRNSSTSDVSTLLTLLSADAEWATLLSVLSLTKVEVGNFLLLHFLRWHRLVHGQPDMSMRYVKGWSYVNANASVSSIFINGQYYLKYYFLRHRNPSPLLEEIQLSVSCYISIFNFHSPKYWKHYRSKYLQHFGGTV